MKHLKALCSIIVMGFIIFLCSCNKELPNVTGDFTVTTFTNGIEVNATFVDTEEHDLYYDNVRAYVVVENENADGVVTEVSRQNVTITKPTVVLNPNGTSTGEKYPHNSVEYDVYVDKDSQKYFILTNENQEQFIYYLVADEAGNLSAKSPQKIVEIPTNFESTKVVISNLTKGTEYTVQLCIAAGSNQRVLKTMNVTTVSGGASQEDPIIITTLQELVGMNKDNDAYYKLGADIDVNGSLTTIFNTSTIFNGHFDGDGHTISNFTITGNNYSGLFGNMVGATVKNLKLKDVKFNVSRGETLLGALSGYAKNCTIENVTVENVEFTYSGRSSATAVIGGLVGEAEGSTIKNCSVSNIKTVVSSAQLNVKVGGFIGINDKSLIENCHVAGSIEATITYTANSDGSLLVGGFAGVNDSNKGIVNSSAIVNITVKEPTTVTASGVKSHKLAVGGFVGSNESFHNRLSNCVAIGDIEVSAKHSYNVFIGGLVGDVCAAGIANLENCVYKAKDKGITATFMEIKEETPTEDVATAAEETEEEVQVQKVYVSLTVGHIANVENSKVVNVFAYNNIMTLTNEHADVVRDVETVNTDISALSQSIQDIIKAN